VRGLISSVVVAVAVVVQLTVVDRIAFPGGAGPNLVLLAVAALALAGGPLTGLLIGFWGGLALDVAPPGSHFTGQNALVFCLIGYACGLLADHSSGDSSADQGHTALFEIVVTAAGAVCGEALVALLGVMLSDPRVTWPAITHVLPAAVAYDVLLSPFVLYAAAASLRLAGTRGEGRPVGWSASQVRTPVPGANQGAIRQLAAGNGPRLRLSDRDKGPGAIRGPRGPGTTGRPAARREPQLKLGRAGSRTSTAAVRGGLGAAFATGSRNGLGTGASKVRFGGRRRAGLLGGSLLGGASLGGSALRGSGSWGQRGSGSWGQRGRGASLGGSALRGSGSWGQRGSGSWGLRGSGFGSSSMGRSLLGGSVFSRSSTPLGLRSPTRSAGGGLSGAAPRFSRGGSLARLTGVLRRSAGPKSPGRGWLRGSSSRRQALGRSSLGRSSLGRSSLGRSSLGRSSLGRGAFGRRRMGRDWSGAGTPRLKARHGARLRMPRPKAKRRWRTGGYR
jgi:rod shape-determining protein MreD